jgi:hypothetical protein
MAVSEGSSWRESNPLVIKKIDPASAWLAPNLPNIVDCVADGHTKHIELARVVGEHHGILTEKHAALTAAVTDNKASGDQALAQAYELLWAYFARQGWELAQAASDQKLETDKQLQALREEHEKDIMAAAARMTLLERSLWRKFVDYLKSMKRNWIARHELPVSDPPVST